MRISDWSSDVCSSDLAVLENPTRWRLILTSVENAPSEYHGLLKLSRGAVFARAEELARAGIALESKLEGLDPVLLAQTMMSFAEMRSAERRVGKECVSTCRYGWFPCH